MFTGRQAGIQRGTGRRRVLKRRIACFCAGTNSANAEFVADVIGEDTDRLQLIRGDEGGTAALTAALAARGVASTSFEDWQRIAAAELAEGERRGKLREKVVTLPELLAIAAGGA